MKWSFRIFTFAGTEVRIHATFFLLLLFVAGHGLMNGQGLAVALESMLFIGVMFTCVLLHEFGHVLAARGYGIRTPDITLLPIGGVARLERMPRKPSQELVVAICGPLVNVIIAAARSPWTSLPPPVGSPSPVMRPGREPLGRLT
jgi:stage IV sporulation protein FB